MQKPKTKPASIDFRTQEIPGYVREIIETHLAIEAEDAKSAGALGFMARALVIATMPYKNPKADVFKRENGDFRLRIVAGYEGDDGLGGIPYGIYPRLILSWVTTEAVRTQSPDIILGDSLTTFLRDVLGLQRGGGKRGSATRVTEQMKRLFGSLITASYTQNSSSSHASTGSSGPADLSRLSPEARSFVLKNVMIADGLVIDGDEANHLDLWTPQESADAGAWKSTVRLSHGFFEECVKSPVPIDLRAYKALRNSPLAMDTYTWLTYRLSYTTRQTKPIRWEALMSQFGSGYDSPRAVLDFKKNFLKALSQVLIIYPQAKVLVVDNGLVLQPSRPHVLPNKSQGELF